MDYHAIHGHDVEGFGTPLTHRILTVSAADVDAAVLSQSSTSSTASGPTAPPRLVPTGIETLDGILSGKTVEAEETETAAEQQPSQPRRRLNSGLRRGQLTEIWGPPGVGKTTFGMQIVANALRDGSSAVWVDCFHPLCGDRLAAIVEAQTRDVEGAKSLEDSFVHYACPSLPHFLAMFCSPAAPAAASPDTPPETLPDMPADAAVVVLDSLSALLNYALPRTADRKGTPLMANGKRGPAAHEKRTQVLQYIVAALERLAETRNLAVVLLTQCASRMQADRGGAALVPAINAVVWDRGIATRLVLFRDWAWKDGEAIGGRFAGVQKLNGGGGDAALSHVIAFSITEAGLVEQHYSAVPPRSAGLALKRKRDENDDNYGWGEEDCMPNMPPQWQGSEDLLLRHGFDEEEEEEAEEAEDAEGAEGITKDEEDIQTHGSDAEGQNHSRPRRSSQSVADSEDDSDF